MRQHRCDFGHDEVDVGAIVRIDGRVVRDPRDVGACRLADVTGKFDRVLGEQRVEAGL